MPWALGRGRVTEPALHRGWKMTLVILFFVGYLLQYPDRPTDVVTLQLSLQACEQVGRSYRIRPEQPGICPFGPTSLSAGDSFSLFTNQMRIRKRDWLIVYPRLVPLEELELPYQALFGDVSARHSIFKDPVRTVGVRDCQGCPRAASETPYEYEGTAARAFSGAPDEVNEITVAFVAVYYGKVPETNAQLQGIRACWDRLKGSLRTKP